MTYRGTALKNMYTSEDGHIHVFKYMNGVPHKMVLKTCGKTTLLRCLQPLLRFVADLGLELEWLGYSRKNYTFPDDQVFPQAELLGRVEES